MIKLSIIIPVYNVEPYIEQCIRSLYDQDIPQEEYEVICVDDCSPDGSIGKIEELRGKNGYRNLTILRHTENKRQGGARNTGLKVAKGEYIWFVDSDDYILPNVLGKLYNEAKKYKLEILTFYPYAQNEMIEYGPCSGSQYVFDAPIAIPIDQRCSVVWSSIYNRNFLESNHIKFVEGYQYEDDDYTYQCFAYSTHVKLLSQAPYILRYVADSTTNAIPNLQKIKDMTEQVKRMIRLEPLLSSADIRWRSLIKECINYSCRGQILEWLKIQPCQSQLTFYLRGYGRINNLSLFVKRKVVFALNSFVFWKLAYK